jgi:hypothetical protein
MNASLGISYNIYIFIFEKFRKKYIYMFFSWSGYLKMNYIQSSPRRNNKPEGIKRITTKGCETKDK